VELARLVTPELTTISVPARELGARAARLLLQRIARRDDEPSDAPASSGQSTRAATPRPLPVRLVVRGTTAAPRDAVPEAHQ
jgi:DNA-binding LacI/PurR family transcriptional regulator